MSMHNPPYPGKFIREVYIEPFGISSRKVAKNLDVSSSTFIRLLKCHSNISPEMALRLSQVLGRSPESWLAMQANYSLWIARQKVDLTGVEKLDFAAV